MSGFPEFANSNQNIEDYIEQLDDIVDHLIDACDDDVVAGMADRITDIFDDQTFANIDMAMAFAMTEVLDRQAESLTGGQPKDMFAVMLRIIWRIQQRRAEQAAEDGDNDPA
jgi:hypothetical protein